MAPLRRLAAPLLLLVVLLNWSPGCRASPLQALADDPTVDTVAPPTDPPGVVDVQEQIYIITGVFVAFIIFLLIVSLGTAYVVIGMRQTIKALQAAGAGLTAAGKSSQAQRRPTKRTAPAPSQPQQRDNRAFAPDDDDDDWRGGDEVENRGYDQFPDNNRNEPARTGRQFSSPSHVSEPQPYDRFHQPLPDAHMPSERAALARSDSNSRYGAGNLARLPKGPAPQAAGYDSRYPDERRARSPGRGQW